ncbi:MAG TPA: outer membrane beta-barrel protein [Acidiferrobacterales bacterium]|nr:outer membrane beta-barrel protein [Acidiferrobacterales bacterium]
MKHFKKSVLAAGIAALCSAPAFAEDKMPVKPGVPTLGQVMDASGIKISGYVDTSYTYLSGAGTFSGGTANRVFDTERNSFNLNMVDLTVSTLPAKGFGGLVELSAGSDAKAITSAGTTNDEFDVTQAYVHYANGPFMTIAGKYVTLSGAEVIRGPDNLNFSRSILFGYAIPFTHTGVRAYYSVGETMKFIVGVNNGWDVLKESASTVGGLVADGKTFELGAQITPIKPLNLAVAVYSGEEPGLTSIGRRDLVDVVATYSFTDNLSVTLNADMAKQEDAIAVGTDAEWSGVAAYVNWKFADQWRVAGRVEQFDDKNGYRTGLTQKWSEATVTLAYMPNASTELRGEVRYDKSDVATAFNQTDGTTDDNQYSVGVQAIYKF